LTFRRSANSDIGNVVKYFPSRKIIFCGVPEVTKDDIDWPTDRIRTNDGSRSEGTNGRGLVIPQGRAANAHAQTGKVNPTKRKCLVDSSREAKTHPELNQPTSQPIHGGPHILDLAVAGPA